MTPAGRLLLVNRIEAETIQMEVTRQMGLSMGTAATLWHRSYAEDEAGLRDRCSRPHRSPGRTDPGIEEQIRGLRRSTKQDSTSVAVISGVPLNDLAGPHLSPAGPAHRQVMPGNERSAPGELVHRDVDKVGKPPSRRRLAGARPRTARDQTATTPHPPRLHLTAHGDR